MDANAVSFRDLLSGFRAFDIDPTRPVIAHASLSAFGQVRGGAETVVGAMLAAFDTVLMPTHTYKTMIIPEVGPENNGLIYGSGKDNNAMAEFFRPKMPADPLMGIVAETLRRHPAARRSKHPILSFAGVNAEAILAVQTLAEPLGLIRAAGESGGWVLLLGVDHSVNTSIHYAEKLAGRKQFVRWALTPSGIVECPGFPGCSQGFEQAAPALAPITRQATIGAARVRALPLLPMIEIIRELIQHDPAALLCQEPGCERCDAVRAGLRAEEAG